MKITFFSPKKKRTINDHRDQVMIVGKKQLEKLAKRGITIQLLASR